MRDVDEVTFDFGASPDMADFGQQVADVVCGLQRAPQVELTDVRLLDMNEPSNRGTLAAVGVDRFLYVHPDWQKTLHRYRSDPDAVLRDSRLARDLGAFTHTLSHEIAHLTDSTGLSPDDALADWTDPRLVPIDEAVTEAWAGMNYSRVVDEVFPQAHAQQILRNRQDLAAYPALDGAVRRFGHDIEYATGVRMPDLIHVAAREPAGYKGYAMARLVTDSTMGSLPDELRTDAIHRLRGEIDRGFVDMARLEKAGRSPDQLTDAGERAGHKLATQVLKLAARIDHAYGPDGSRREVDKLQRTGYRATDLGAAKFPHGPDLGWIEVYRATRAPGSAIVGSTPDDPRVASSRSGRTKVYER